jgi:hypothetical protein
MYPCYIAPRLTGIPPEHEQTSGRAVHPAAWRLAPGLRSLHQCDNRTNLRSFSFVLLTAGPQALAHGAKDLNLLSEAGGLLRTPRRKLQAADRVLIAGDRELRLSDTLVLPTLGLRLERRHGRFRPACHTRSGAGHLSRGTKKNTFTLSRPIGKTSLQLS